MPDKETYNKIAAHIMSNYAPDEVDYASLTEDAMNLVKSPEYSLKLNETSGYGKLDPGVINEFYLKEAPIAKKHEYLQYLSHKLSNQTGSDRKEVIGKLVNTVNDMGIKGLQYGVIEREDGLDWGATKEVSGYEKRWDSSGNEVYLRRYEDGDVTPVGYEEFNKWKKMSLLPEDMRKRTVFIDTNAKDKKSQLGGNLAL